MAVVLRSLDFVEEPVPARFLEDGLGADMVNAYVAYTSQHLGVIVSLDNHGQQKNGLNRGFKQRCQRKN